MNLLSENDQIDGTITVKEYSLPFTLGFASHIGIEFSYHFDGRLVRAEINFGSTKDGQYQPMGMPWDLSDKLGGIWRALDLNSQVVASVNYDDAYVQALSEAVESFKEDLESRGIGYALTPNAFDNNANSNSAASFAMRIVGIDPSTVKFSKEPVSIGIDISGKQFKLPSPSSYTASAYQQYFDRTVGASGVPIPTPNPQDITPSTTPGVELSVPQASPISFTPATIAPLTAPSSLTA